MEIAIGIINIIAGIYVTLLGFKVLNPFKGKNEPEKEALWYKKFEKFFIFGGILIIFCGFLILLLELRPYL